MKLSKTVFALLIGIALILSAAYNARTEWLGGEDSEYIVLIRVDHATQAAPRHEINHGVYGYYNIQGQFKTMLNLNTLPGGPVSPYSWNNLLWVPGPLDADTTGGPS